MPDTSDLVRLDAADADVHTLGCSIDESPDALDVRIPAAVDALVRERDGFTEERLLATDLAYGGHSSEATNFQSEQRPKQAEL